MHDALAIFPGEDMSLKARLISLSCRNHINKNCYSVIVTHHGPGPQDLPEKGRARVNHSG